MLPPGGFAPGYVLAVVALVLAIFRARLGSLSGDPRSQHLLLGTTVVVAVLWNIRAMGTNALEIHVLGTTAATLVLGAPRALLATAAAQALVAFRGDSFLASAALSWLFSGVIPAFVTDGVRRLAETWLPHHLFVYLFVVCFAGAAVALGVTHVAADLSLGSPVRNALPPGGIPLFLLLAFPEAFVNGVVMTMLVIYRPDWVATWDDRRLG